MCTDCVFSKLCLFYAVLRFLFINESEKERKNMRNVIYAYAHYGALGAATVTNFDIDNVNRLNPVATDTVVTTITSATAQKAAPGESKSYCNNRGQSSAKNRETSATSSKNSQNRQVLSN